MPAAQTLSRPPDAFEASVTVSDDLRAVFRALRGLAPLSDADDRPDAVPAPDRDGTWALADDRDHGSAAAIAEPPDSGPEATPAGPSPALPPIYRSVRLRRDGRRPARLDAAPLACWHGLGRDGTLEIRPGSGPGGGLRPGDVVQGIALLLAPGGEVALALSLTSAEGSGIWDLYSVATLRDPSDLPAALRAHRPARAVPHPAPGLGPAQAAALARRLDEDYRTLTARVLSAAATEIFHKEGPLR